MVVWSSCSNKRYAHWYPLGLRSAFWMWTDQFHWFALQQREVPNTSRRDGLTGRGACDAAGLICAGAVFLWISPA